MNAYTKTMIVEMTQADLLAVFSACSLARRQLAAMPADETDAHNWAADIEQAQGRLSYLLLEAGEQCPDLDRELRSMVDRGEPRRANPR